ncbi:MAG: D-2-hydroxyacid dehydrogenase [Phycisphaerae bacterium]|nr:D-2-hydroxyacid dehydrogenase [Gemmatimonadaceae bacterium]
MTRRVVVDLVSSAPHMQIPAWGAERLRTNVLEGWDVVVIKSPTMSRGEGTNQVSEETLDAVKTAEAYFGYGVSTELLAADPLLKWAHSASAGVGGSLTPALQERGVMFTNGAGVYAEGMADTVLAGALHFVRGIDLAVRRQHEGRWDPGPWMQPAERIRELADCRVVVIGTGGIGGAVGRRFQVLGCRCFGVRRRPELGAPTGFEQVVGFGEMESILPQGDIVVVTAPLTASTRLLMNGARLALLPDGAIVVNVARGALLDEDALLAELNSGRLRGAALDVFASEPLAADSPFWRHPRVLVTPHVSGVSPYRHWDRTLTLFETNWRWWNEGKTLQNIVDAKAGY